MPNFIRCSSEFGRWVQTQAAEANEPMTVVLDRIMAELNERRAKDESKRTEEGDKSGSPKRARATKKRDTKAKQSGGKLVEGMEDLYED